MPQILICQNLRNNLQHPNEYIRGVTLRFLCRIKEEEILEPLIPSVLANLEHRHSYVRRTAVLAVNAIYKLPKGIPYNPTKLLSDYSGTGLTKNARFCSAATSSWVGFFFSFLAAGCSVA